MKYPPHAAKTLNIPHMSPKSVNILHMPLKTLNIHHMSISITRTFKMKVTQIECGAVNRAFEGCLQYYHEVGTLMKNFTILQQSKYI